jgi:RNA polymerase sigma-70 factor (ECF subfamily)
LLLTLDRLSPLERAAFLLHDVFDFSFSEVATAYNELRRHAVSGRAGPRPCARRPTARRDDVAAFERNRGKHAQLMSAFVAATRSGDLNRLTHLLASDVRLVTDGAGKVSAALNVLDGADRAAQFLVGTARKGFEIEDDRIRAVYVVRNPDKASALGPCDGAGRAQSLMPLRS